MLRAVLLDVDFTLFRPGPELGPEGYQRAGARHGIALDPARYEDARLGAFEGFQAHPELVHDEDVWIRFTEDIVRGMGGDGRRRPGVRRSTSSGSGSGTRTSSSTTTPSRRSRPCARTACASGSSRTGSATSTSSRATTDSTSTSCIGSMRHGHVKPHRSIFEAALTSLDATPEEAAMVGDSYADDIEGARALGMRAILVDREGLHAGEPDRIDTLLALPAALGLAAQEGTASILRRR